MKAMGCSFACPVTSLHPPVFNKNKRDYQLRVTCLNTKAVWWGDSIPPTHVLSVRGEYNECLFHHIDPHHTAELPHTHARPLHNPALPQSVSKSLSHRLPGRFMSLGSKMYIHVTWTKQNRKNWNVVCTDRLEMFLSNSVSFSGGSAGMQTLSYSTWAELFKCYCVGIRAVGDDHICTNKNSHCTTVSFQCFKRLTGLGKVLKRHMGDTQHLVYSLHLSLPCLTDTLILHVYTFSHSVMSDSFQTRGP